jgi:uncharacterized protein YkwD
MTGRRTRRAGRRVAIRRGGLAALLAAVLALTAMPDDADAEDCFLLLVPDCGGPPPTTTTSVPDAPAPTTTTTAPPPTTSTSTTTSTTVPTALAAATRLLDLANQERARTGLAPLVARADVTEIAQAWSGELARRGKLAHNDEYFTAATRKRLGAKVLGENVAYAGDTEAAHRALMNSSGHRANILDRRFSVVGVGAVVLDGRWWFTQDFVEPVAAPVAAPGTNPPPVAPAVVRQAGDVARGAGAPTAKPSQVTGGGAAPSQAHVLDVVQPRPGVDGPRAATVAPLRGSRSSGWWALLATIALLAPLLFLAAHVRERAAALRRSTRRIGVTAAREDGAVGDRGVPDRASAEVPQLRESLRHHVAVIEALTAARHDPSRRGGRA